MTISVNGSNWIRALKKYNFSETELENMAAWALKRYFNPEYVSKPWYKGGVTQETVLQELADNPYSPITPDQLSDTWKLLPAIRKGLGREDLDAELDAVQLYLKRDKGAMNIPVYNQGEATLSDMARTLGDITPTMVNKVFLVAARKLKELTQGSSPEDMDDEVLRALQERIDTTREQTAREYACLLKLSGGDIRTFFDSLLRAHLMGKTDFRRISGEEMQWIKVLSTFEEEEIERILLADINQDTNVFLTFQNAASKKLFPSKAGRPKGSGKKVSVEEEPDEELEELGI